MSIDPRPGMIRFNGAAKAYPVTVCDSCDIVLPHETSEKQLAWALEHQRTGHRVKFAVDVRPDPTQPFAFVTQKTLEAYQPLPGGGGGQWSPPWQHQTWHAGKATLTQTDNQVEIDSDHSKSVAQFRLNARERRRQRRKDLQQKDNSE